MGLSLSRNWPGSRIFFLLNGSRGPLLRLDPRIANVDARRSCQGWPSHLPCGMFRPCQAIPSQLRARRHAQCDRDDDQRGARFRARFNRATTLYPVGPRTRTMMQSCASAAKLRSGGPILPLGVKAKGRLRDTATSNRHRRPVTSVRTRPKLSWCLQRPPLLCRTQNDAIRDNALPHEPPQGDQ